MPKSDQLVLRAGPQFTADVYAIEWPATVERIEGQWLRISDHSGYGVPPVSGWVSKEEVLNVADAHNHYLELLQTTDAPWIHWLLGICLEQSRESVTAQDEYARSLNVPSRDPNAVRATVEKDANLLDAAVRLERLQASAAKSAEEAAATAAALQDLFQTAARIGAHRPYVLFEQAEAFRKGYRSKLAEVRRGIHGLDAQIAAANSERSGGASAIQDLFSKAEESYMSIASGNPGDPCNGPHCWKGLMGRAELYLDRIAVLEDEAWSLIKAGARSTVPAGAKMPAASPATSAADRFDAPAKPIDLEILDAFLKKWRSPQQQSVMAKQVEAASVCLVEEIQLLEGAVRCFDTAIARNPDLVEAYRDRGLAYLALARCEATLAAMEEADGDLQPRLASLYPGREFSPHKLDRALVDGRRHFNEVIDKLPLAKAKEAEIAAEKKELTGAVEQIAAGYVAAAAKHGGFAGKDANKAQAATPPKSELVLLREKLGQLRIEAAKAEEQLDQEEKKAKESLSAANESLDDAYTLLSKSENLGKAQRSAQTACEKGNFAGTESLKILAAIFASQCNFDRAEFYQKMATTFASDNERHQILETLNDYRQMGELVVTKAKAKTAPTLPGQGKGAKGADGGQAGDNGTGE
jgi:hypothetical protein